jgi:Protein of unknown function (DUF3891)
VLVRPDEDGALAIGQLSHSWLSGQIARAWGNDRFTPPEPREEVVLGAQQHDLGWADFDLQPLFNPASGLPRSFVELSVDDHLAIWRGAPERLSSQSLHAALVVSLHGCALSELRLARADDDAAALRAHIDEERARQLSLRASLGVSEEQARLTQRQMWAWDGLSLALCNGWSAFTAREVPAQGGWVDLQLHCLGGELWTLDPWPFERERVEVRCEARRLAGRYEDEQAMRDGLERARPVTLSFILTATRSSRPGSAAPPSARPPAR